LDREVGGLGVRRIREFNLSLLAEWCWRMLVNREGLWFRVLASRYDLVGGRLKCGDRNGSVWWRDIASIRDGDASVLGSWFPENLRIHVGNGANTLFWLDRWVGDVPLCVRFSRLYDLSENKLAAVAQMFSWGWEVGGEAWKWRRRMWDWEEDMVVECRSLLLTVLLHVDIEDVCTWIHDPVEGYTVSGAYRMITDRTPPTNNVPAALLWRKDVPVKVSVFA